MESKIRRSRDVDRVMTVIFYLVAIFFFALLIGFAGKVIIGVRCLPPVREIT